MANTLPLPLADPKALPLRRLIGPVVQANRFDLTDGRNIVRILAGLFYAPHV